jgi:cysteine peptidase C11 family protein
MTSERADVETGVKREVRPWTVMVYMAAGDSAEMDDYAVRNLREMQRGANEHVHVAVQLKRHWPEIPQRYVISGNERRPMAQFQSTADPNDVDMGDRETLADFLKWAVKECPANHYMLVLWGHSYGLGFGRDHGDPLRLKELAEALDEFRKKRTELKLATEGTLEILGANACAMAYVEAAYELHTSAKYLLASQIYVPYAGWPYDAVLQSITATTEPEELGLNVIDSYVTGLNNPLTGERVQMSLLDLSHARGLRTAIDDLAIEIRGAFKSDGHFDSGRRAAIRDAFIAAAAGDVRPLVDLKNLSHALKSDLCDPQSRAFLAANLNISGAKRDWLDSSATRLEQQLGQVASVFRRLLVKMAAHSSLAELGGVGIYVPFVTDEQDLKRLGLEDEPYKLRVAQDPTSETSRTTYEKLALFSDAHGPRGTWPALVYDDLSEPIPSELVDLIADIGVTSSADRAEIAQIVLSIESAFNKLDRVLDIAQTVMTERMRHTPPTYTPNQTAKQPPLRLMPYTRGSDKAAARVQVSEPILLEWFRKLEDVLEEVERVTRKGLTQARFGLAPVMSPRGFDPDGPVKTDQGAPPRDERDERPGFSGGPVKTDLGREAESTTSARSRVSDEDADVGPAFLLFSRAADALRRLEQAVSELEGQAGPSLGADILDRRALGLRRALGILCETATSARRTIRKVIANPAYGLGPGTAAFDRDDREELANRAGMSVRDLVLLSVNSLAPDPDEDELLFYEKAH